jgi:NAD(P)H-hydrate epimerase
VAGPPRIAPLPRDAHKGVRGRVLLVAGSLRMSGAARLAGWGALRGGAGLVTIATPDAVHAVVAADLPCAMTLPLPTRKGAFAASGAAAARAFAEGVDAVGAGPGITTLAGPFLGRMLAGLSKPLCLDADGLNLLAEDPRLLGGARGPRVLTPHPGEAARLLGREIEPSADARLAAAAEIADRFGAVAVLKGAGTVVCDGEQAYVEAGGNPGMATGGTGDVLTGLLTARLAAGIDPFDAAVQAVWLHARAGDLAAAAVGEHSMVATDLVASLPAAVAGLVETPPRPRTTRRTGSRRPPRGGR